MIVRVLLLVALVGSAAVVFYGLFMDRTGQAIALTVAGLIVLIVLGVAALIYQGITYTTRDTVVDIGPIHATAERHKTIPLPPVLGVVFIAGGVVLLATGGRK